MNKQALDILLVDDDQDYSDIMAFWLKSKGHKVVQKLNGLEALELLKNSTPDIVFLDIDMPEINGIETLKKIREQNKKLPVIMVTAHTTPQRMEIANSLGGSAFFNKSDDFTEAAGLIREAIT